MPHLPKLLPKTVAATAAAATLGGLFTQPGSGWYRGLAKPVWQPPPQAFGVVWTALYADIAITSSLVIADLAEQDRAEQDRAGQDRVEQHRAGPGKAAAFERALWLNLALNAGWSAVFFRSRRLGLATVWAAALTASGVDLARRAVAASSGKAAALAPYAAWCGFATVLSAAVARRNR